MRWGGSCVFDPLGLSASTHQTAGAEGDPRRSSRLAVEAAECDDDCDDDFDLGSLSGTSSSSFAPESATDCILSSSRATPAIPRRLRRARERSAASPSSKVVCAWYACDGGVVAAAAVPGAAASEWPPSMDGPISARITQVNAPQESTYSSARRFLRAVILRFDGDSGRSIFAAAPVCAGWCVVRAV